MSEPREFRIVQDMQTALKGISIAGGYHHDVATLAVKLDPNHDVEELIGEQALRPFLILDLAPDEFTYPEAPSGLLLLMPFAVHAVNDSDPADDDALLKAYFRLCADVEQALAVDIKRGNLATDTRVLTRQMREVEGQGQQVWAIVAGQVRVRRTYGAPN